MRSPIIGACRGTQLIIMHPDSNIQHVIEVGDMIYAAEVAEAINKVAVPEEEERLTAR